MAAISSEATQRRAFTCFFKKRHRSSILVIRTSSGTGGRCSHHPLVSTPRRSASPSSRPTTPLRKQEKYCTRSIVVTPSVFRVGIKIKDACFPQSSFTSSYLTVIMQPNGRRHERAQCGSLVCSTTKTTILERRDIGPGARCSETMTTGNTQQ